MPDPRLTILAKGGDYFGHHLWTTGATDAPPRFLAHNLVVCGSREGDAAVAKDPQPPPEEEAEDADTRIAPDPLAAVLPALSALGAIASIATINWVAQEKTAERARARRKAGVALRDLESCCMGLQEIFKRLHRNPKLFGGEGSAVTSPLKFGVHGPRIDQATTRTYHQLMNDIASMLVLASQNAFDVMCAVEDGEITAPEQLFYGFGEQQDRLNKLIQNRATLKLSVETGLDVADKLSNLVRELKKYKID